MLILTLGGVLALQPLIANAQAQTPVDLGTAESFAVLAGEGVANTGFTVVTGDLGTHPNPAVTGFPPGTVTGAIHEADAVALQAQTDLTTAYNDAAGRTPVTTIATELGGVTLNPGVYDSLSGTFEISVGQTLTLDAQGDPDGVFIFQMAATLVTFDSSDVNLIGSASPCNVWWQVGSSATLGTNSNFTGTIMALASIEVQTDAVVEGRVLARTASVTLDDADIDASACIAAPSPPPTSPPPTSQVPSVPSGGPATGGGSTDGGQGVVLLWLGGALLAAAAGTFAIRRRSMRHE
ncbi:MAG TPA: ice-binding family protein [Actinomycetota bacterium]|nr:ice-binding family protein [Actinomycetota bacterium]